MTQRHAVAIHRTAARCAARCTGSRPNMRLTPKSVASTHLFTDENPGAADDLLAAVNQGFDDGNRCQDRAGPGQPTRSARKFSSSVSAISASTPTRRAERPVFNEIVPLKDTWKKVKGR